MKTFLTFLVTLFAAFSALAQPVRLNWATTNISTTVTQIVSGIPSRVATNLASGGMITNGHVIGSLTASNLTGVGTGSLNQTNTQITAKNQSFTVRTADGSVQLKVALTGGVEATDISALSVAGNGEALTNLNGGYIQVNTINSNKFDAATRALLGGGGQIALSTNYVMEYWGAVREDGLPGDGSLWNPFDLSTQAKFDAIWPEALPEYSVLNLQSGTYQTTGSGASATSEDLMKAGQVLRGAGLRLTTLQIVYATNVAESGYAVVRAGDNSPFAAVENLTIDCAPNGVIVTNVCVSGIVMEGSGCRVSNVRVIHWGSRAPAEESFGIIMNSVQSGPQTNNVVENCIVESGITNGTGGATLIAVIGWNTNFPGIPNAEQYGGIVRNNYVDGGSYRVQAYCNGIGVGSNPGIAEGNLIFNTTAGIYNDTVPFHTTILRNNYFRNNTRGVDMPFATGGSAGLTNQLWDTLIISGNVFEIGPGPTDGPSWGISVRGLEGSTNAGAVIIKDNVFQHVDASTNTVVNDNIAFATYVVNVHQMVVENNISKLPQLAAGHWPYEFGNVTRAYAFLNRTYDGIRVPASNIITGELIDEMPTTATSAGGWTKYGSIVSSNDFGITITDGGNIHGVTNIRMTNEIINAQTEFAALHFDLASNQLNTEDGSGVVTASTTQGRTGLNSPNGASSINLSNSGVIGIEGTIQGTGTDGGYLDMQNSGGTTTIVLNAESGNITASSFTGDSTQLTNTYTYNVKNFGAAGDETQDDTVPIQAALDAAAAVASATVYFPRGSYKIAGTLTYTNLGGPGYGVRFLGEQGFTRGPSATTISWYGSSGGTMFYGVGMNSSRFEEIDFNGRGIAKYGVHLDAWNVEDPGSPGSSGNSFERMTFTGFVGAGSAGVAVGHADTGSGTVQVSEISFTRCLFIGTTGSDNGFLPLEGGNVQGFGFFDCGSLYLTNGLQFLANNTITIVNWIGGANEVDIRSGSSSISVNGLRSEASKKLLVQSTGANGAGAILNGIEWYGTCGTDDIAIETSGSLSIFNSVIGNARTAGTFPRIVVNNPLLSDLASPSAIFSVGNHYIRATNAPPFQDAVGNLFFNEAGYYSNKVLNAVSTGDIGGFGGDLIKFATYDFAGGHRRVETLMAISTSGNARLGNGMLVLTNGTAGVGVTNNADGTIKASSTITAGGGLFTGGVGFAGLTNSLTSYLAGNVGIGIASPDTTLHVHTATAGAVTAVANSVLALENSTHSYLNFLVPSGEAAGIFVGQGVNNAYSRLTFNFTGPNGTWDMSTAVAGITSRLLVQNTDNTSASSQASLKLSAGGASAGDAYTEYNVIGAISWMAGVDNSDSDKFKIGNGSLGGGSDFLTITTAGSVGIGTTTPSQTLTVNGTLSVTNDAWFGGDVSVLTLTDRSKAPFSLKDSYEIVQSMKSKNGQVDHDALSPLAWGTKTRIVTNTAPRFVNGIRQMSPQPGTVVEPDQTKRNLSIITSALGDVVNDLIKRNAELQRRLDKLEKK